MVRAHSSMFHTLTDNIRSAFSTAEKKKYISAVKCMAKLPSKTPKSVCPGCRNRYDDFVTTHIQQTFTVRIPSKEKGISLMFSRSTPQETSSPGTVTLLGHTRRLCVTNVATKATSPTTTGRNGPTTLASRLLLTGLTHL
jgi:hypothetical protein